MKPSNTTTPPQTDSGTMSTKQPIQIHPVRTAVDLEARNNLFRAYALSIGVDLSFQNFEAEMDAMPGKYAPPNGELLLARDQNGLAIGCVALRPLGPWGFCEMKRLYVAPAGRGLGVGKALVGAILDVARRIGYGEMRLDTLGSMRAALKLYRGFGFGDALAYYENPLPDVVFLALLLKSEPT